MGDPLEFDSEDEERMKEFYKKKKMQIMEHWEDVDE